MKITEVAENIGGRIVGSADVEITGAATLEEATSGDIAFLALNNYYEKAKNSNASAIFVLSEVEGCKATQVVCSDPYLAFAKTMRMLYPTQKYSQEISEKAEIIDAELGEGCTVFPFAYIGKNVKIGKNSVIHPHTNIGDSVIIGDDCVVHSHVSIRENCIIGDRVILQNGCRIGSDGYGFAKDENQRHLKIPQRGSVVIGNDVEIGANCCIDRATLSKTTIGDGTKLDNLVQVGHNVKVGNDCLLVAQVGIAGSSTIGDRVTLAGQVGISGHLTIGNDSTVGGKAGVTRDVPPQEVYAGYPAMQYSRWKKIYRMLNEMADTVSENDDE